MSIHSLFHIFIICLIMPVQAFGFDVAAGAKGGIGFPSYSGSDYKDLLAGGGRTETRVGFSAGAFISFGISDPLAIQLEALYSKLGGNFGDSYSTWYDNADAIEVPVLVKYRFRSGNFILGPYTGPDLIIKAGNYDFEVKAYDGTLLMSGYWKDQYIRVPLVSLVFGFGVEFMVNPVFFISIDGRYTLGIMSRFTDDSGLKDWKQNNLQFLLGFGTMLSGKRTLSSKVR